MRTIDVVVMALFNLIVIVFVAYAIDISINNINTHIDARFDELRKDPVHVWMEKKVGECK